DRAAVGAVDVYEEEDLADGDEEDA
ncbi:MAG: hypothetical protein JWN40_494, partial [Phycisphaerales bacterium]|nr:hypothetical protein [Phycisphaerales bacterium]